MPTDKTQRTFWFAITLLSLALAAVAGAEDAFTAEALRFAMPKAREVGADGYTPLPSRNGSEYHFRGEDCSRCHVEGGKATNYPFTMAGTVYADFDGTEPVAGAEVILEDASGATISMLSNDEGNFFTTTPLEGGFYKSWVKRDDRIVPMVTVPRTGHVGSWMSCNMHHFPESPRGALFVPTGITLRQYPTRDVRFDEHVKPVLLSQCRPCHVPAETNPLASQLLGDGTITYDFSGGLDLTSYDALIAAWDANPELLDTDDPKRSTLLTKVLVEPATDHAGGQLWKTTDPDYELLRLWIAEGAQR